MNAKVLSAIVGVSLFLSPSLASARMAPSPSRPDPLALIGPSAATLGGDAIVTAQTNAIHGSNQTAAAITPFVAYSVSASRNAAITGATKSNDVTTIADNGSEKGTRTQAKLGAFAWSNPRFEARFAAWLGKSPTIATDYIFVKSSWEAMVAHAESVSLKWSTQAPQYQISYGLAMLVVKEDTLAKGASGAYDTYYRDIARTLIKNGESNAILRIGWEFNGNWYPWAAQRDPKNFVAYWRRIVRVMRSEPGQRFTFDWNVSANWDVAFDPASAYPGDDVVDTIGIDFYDVVNTEPFGTSDPVQRWETLKSNPYSLDWANGFATRHDKPMAFDEWAVGCKPSSMDPIKGCTEASNGGDDPYFVHQMHAWIQTHNVAWHSYFDSQTYYGGQYHALSTDEFPLSAAAFIADFGAPSASRTPTAKITQSLAATTSDGANGQPFNVEWSSVGVTSCVIAKTSPDGVVDHQWKSGAAGFQRTILTEVGAYHFEIDCAGPDGAVSASMDHAVTPAPMAK